MRVRTGYSFRSAMGQLADVIERIDTDWAPITDRAATFGFNNWTKLCKKKGKRPIYGVELAVSPEPTAKKVTRSHFTFIATDSLVPLNRLVWRASEQFRYEPLLRYEDVAEVAREGSLLIFPGRNAILSRLDPRWENLKMFNSPGMPSGLIAWAEDNGVELVAGSDNYYPNADDRDAYEVLCGRGATTQVFPMHILSRGELLAHCGEAAVEAAERLAARCTATLQPATLLKPEHPATLEAMCREGAEKLGCDLTDPVYAARLKRELDMIAEKDFADYFYIIADLVAFAKKHMFVGPARGSSCGSLVCYLLGITTIDPIPYDLIFERFIDINRSDLPDIDIDFNDERRHLAFEYLEKKYGKQRVARLGAVSRYKPTAAINETAAALKIPKWRTEAFTGSIIDRSSGDARALQAIEDTFKDTETGRKLLADFPELILAQRLEGHPRHYTQHAAGVVVTERPVEEYVARDCRTKALMCDKKDAEDLNLLKIDCLGLTQLSIFDDCLEMIGKKPDYLINYPLDDKAAFEVLNQKRWSGIFQFMGDALQSICQSVKIVELEDIIAITALARPGPLASGGTAQWIERKNGREPISYPHPSMESILGSSLGIVVYQEQVMLIGREIGGLTWDDVTALRKAMSKSLGKEFFDQYGDRFKAGAEHLGMRPEKLNRLWDDLCAYGSWAFNRSHSVAYGLISYWCCVLKAHHPLEFAAATLSHQDDPNKQLKMLREMVREGYEYQPVDAELSTNKWQAGNGKLIGPLTNVQGLGPKMMEEVLSARVNGHEIPKRAAKLLASPVTKIDELNPVEKRLKVLVPDGLHSINILTRPTDIIDCQCETIGGREVLVIAKIMDINPRNLNEPQLVAKRGGRTIDYNPDFLNMIIEDDTDQVRATIWGRLFEQLARPIMDRGDAGNGLYALKGKMGTDFRGIDVERVKYLGTMK